MLVSVATHPAPRAKPLSVSVHRAKLSGPVTMSLLKWRRGQQHQQQTRGYRFGMWSSHLEPEFHRDLRRHHRVLKYKYTKSLNRRLSWEHPLAQDSQAIWRRVVGRYWSPAGSQFGSRFVNTGETARNAHRQTHKEEKPGYTSVYNAATSALEGGFDAWKTELNAMVNSWTKQAINGAKRPKSTVSNKVTSQKRTSASNTPTGEEYVIDPITNRKVLKRTYGSVETDPHQSVKSFKSYRSQFVNFAPPADVGQDQRQPVHSNGPPPKEELSKYKEVATDEALAHEDTSTLQSQEYSLNHLPPEEASEIRNDLENYSPSQYDEVRTAEEPDQKYDDLDKYQSHNYNEPASVQTDTTPAYEDLHQYKPYMHAENAPVEQVDPPYKDLEKYATFVPEEDVQAKQSSPEYEDLDKYKPSHFDGVQTQEPTSKYDDLEKYKPYHYQEGVAASESNPKYEDLDNYKPTEFSDASHEQEEKPFQEYGDLEQYKAYRFQEPQGKAALGRDVVNESLKEFDLKAQERETLEKSMADHITASNAADREAVANVQASRQKTGDEKSRMTGNFIRDFPEDFSQSWNSHSTGLQPEQGATASYEQHLQRTVQSQEKDVSDGLSRAANTPALEPALDRHVNSKVDSRTRRSQSRQSKNQTAADPYSRQPQGLETSYAEECGPESTRPAYVKTYGTPEDNTAKDNRAEQATAIPLEQLVDDIPPAVAHEAVSNSQPTVYKILAYDSTMQNVSIAETTSVVPDQAAPLTPAEVLLRLSNPSKFFPHFAPLQAQGFEIVSGSGDVLVFRKVRDAPAASSGGSRPHPVNPIDMMGKPAALPNAAAFASPTGFINYDLPPVEEQSPPFRSNIDVRREEPVFSGPRTTPLEGARTRRKKRSVTKRVLIGGAWVAGVSYALGVVAEYFVTGGADGRGPTGF
ncbi:uncharacterized protein JN550_002512 [Neoarthrinium moseri]|uniref:uncharacterized protein n=1 Tax=Neoarthrinium moseri TaxID=1658444 RepID=UPI001FDB01B4|nr:uncharacterized protein JN550_002512 [Neoarthrinium moseri]KAI1875083.1 hypothetical protein JN550_002512 [Neoarthrinium moseri]